MYSLEELGYHKATWTNGKSKKRGWWIYNYNSDRFKIILDSKDPITGQDRVILVSGDVPEWGKWVRIKDAR
jgi:hypothetical protein